MRHLLPPVLVRRGQLRDVAALAALDATCRTEAWEQAIYERELQQASRLAWLAELNDKLLGFAWVSVVDDFAELENIVVAPDARRSGLGRLLLESVLSELKTTTSVARLQLEVRASNVAALRLYEALGFTEEGRRPAYYRNEDAVLMSVRWK